VSFCVWLANDNADDNAEDDNDEDDNDEEDGARVDTIGEDDDEEAEVAGKT
jgi:hypothetical protein